MKKHLNKTILVQYHPSEKIEFEKHGRIKQTLYQKSHFCEISGVFRL